MTMPTESLSKELTEVAKPYDTNLKLLHDLPCSLNPRNLLLERVNLPSTHIDRCCNPLCLSSFSTPILQYTTVFFIWNRILLNDWILLQELEN
ncbi:hypothetical protein KC19_N003800 [Ceratodon purpureus]|nr:hypothetical protein KC19_N003800 [Ceratodon purpureus]